MHLLPAGNNTVSNSLRHSGGMLSTGSPLLRYDHLCGVNLRKLQYIYMFCNMVATNLEYSGISLNMVNSWNSQGILCSLRENWLRSGRSLCQAIHMQPSVPDVRKLLIWAIWDDRLLLITWVVSWCGITLDIWRLLLFIFFVVLTSGKV